MSQVPLDSELEQIFNSVTEGIGQIDRQGRILRINQQAQRFAKGLIRPGMTLLHGCRILKTRTEEGALVTRNAQLPTFKVFSSGETVRDATYVMITPITHKKRFVSLTAAPIRNPQGQVVSAALHLTDITQQKEAEKQIEDFALLLSDKIAAQNRETEEFIYGITHDLKAPIVTIQGFLRQIDQKHRQRLPADAQRQLEILMQASDRLWRMVDGLLKYARISEESDSSQLTEQTPVLQHVLRDQTHELQASRAQIRLGPLPPAYVSESHSYHIWSNLIGNALRYRHPRRRLRVQVGYNAKLAAYFVKDNGIGIQPKFLGQIFKIFVRFGGDTRSTGIGLSHVKKIVETANGKIWVKSQPGKSTCFYFSLPGR